MNSTELSTGRVLVDFYADWCQPCNQLAPNLERFQQEQDLVRVVMVDVDQELELVLKWGVRSIPTLLYLENGELIARETGVKTIQQLKKLTNVENI